MKKSLIACLISSALLVGCGPKELTTEQQNEVNQLKTELAQTESSIKAAHELDQQYTGGMIKSLNAAKTEVLETNKALLQQRINAIESGATIEIKVPALKPNPEAAEAIQKEINALKGEIEAAKIEAAQYSGGLVLSLKMAGIAAQEQTIALLQQKYLSAKYGLPEVKIPAPAAEPQHAAPKTAPKKAAMKLPPADGPFGLEAGLSAKNIEDMAGIKLQPVEGQYHLYTASTLPKGNGAFGIYTLLISPDVGLCSIQAFGNKELTDDNYGINLRSKIDELKSSLDSIYGEGKKTDTLMPGSVWSEPQDWMMGVYKNERQYNAIWYTSNEAMQKNKLRDIYLGARAENGSKGIMLLQYDFVNSETCAKEAKEAQKASL